MDESAKRCWLTLQQSNQYWNIPSGNLLHSDIEHGPVEIVDIYPLINNMVIFHQFFVCLPGRVRHVHCYS